MILKKAFSDSLSTQKWSMLITPSFTGIGSYIMTYKNIFSFTIGLSIIIALISVVIFWLSRFIYFLFKHDKATTAEIENLVKEKGQNKDEYVSTVKLMSDAQSAITWLSDHKVKQNIFAQTMEFVCDRLKEIFDIHTKSDCSISIKIPITSENISSESQVINICRDSSSLDRNSTQYMETPHKVFANTCFNSICSSLHKPDGDHFYVNNDLENSPDYQTTSKSCYHKNILPYKSEAVVPIIPLYEEEGNVGPNVLGFLCVDSDIAHAFDKDRTIPILKGIADNIHGLLSKRSEFSELNIDESVYIKTNNIKNGRSQFQLKDRKAKANGSRNFKRRK